MPYANIHEAFNTYTDNLTESSSGSLRNSDNYRSNNIRSHQIGGDTASSTAELRNIEQIQRPFNINNTDPADDFPDIAANYVSDGYNFKYSGLNEWDVLDPQLKTTNEPANRTVFQSPDRVVSAAQLPSTKLQPITQQRSAIDKIWDRPTSSEVDSFKMNQDVNLDMFGGIGTAPGSTSVKTGGQNNGVTMIAAPKISENLDLVGAPTSPVVCSDEHCMSMLNHIMGCQGCVEKLRKLLGTEESTKILGMAIPEINLSKLMFWIILIILIVAVYELLNTLFRRLRGVSIV